MKWEKKQEIDDENITSGDNWLDLMDIVVNLKIFYYLNNYQLS